MRKLKDIVLAVLAVVIVVLFGGWVSGCASTVNSLKDDRFTTGCVVIEANAKLGYFNQEGNAEACKLVCSDTLPEGFLYEYESRGCSIKVGVTK